jgi:hypothetical protein
MEIFIGVYLLIGTCLYSFKYVDKIKDVSSIRFILFWPYFMLKDEDKNE